MAAIYDHLPHGYYSDDETGDPLDSDDPIVYCCWVRDGSRDVIVTHPILYVDPQGDEWLVRPGDRSNGQSTPFVLWPFMQPYQGKARDAAVVHDIACMTPGVDWDKAAWVYYHALIAAGVGSIRAWIRWAAVRFPGKLWNWAKGLCKRRIK